MSNDSGSILDEARSAYRAGLCILPVASDGTKRPEVPTWTPCHTARPTAAQMRAFQFARRHRFGMIAGLVSGRRGAWDFNCHDTYRAFVAAAGAGGLDDVVQRIETSYCDETPAGGRRSIMQYAEGVVWRDETLARRPGGVGEPVRWVDPGVVELRDLFRRPLEAVPAPRVPSFLFRPDVPYVQAACFSCGDPLPVPRFSRCWRCSLAWRLACCVPLSTELAAAMDAARVA